MSEWIDMMFAYQASPHDHPRGGPAMNDPCACYPGPPPDEDVAAWDPSGEDPYDEATDEDPWDEDPDTDVPPRFWQEEAADALPPGSLLAGLTDKAVLDLGRLSDNELIGVLHATRRQLAREHYKQVLVIAEFGRRRQAAFADALARGVPAGCSPGGFPGEELAAELAVTRAEAGHRIDDALDLTSRLPLTLAGMAAGQIDAGRAGWIALYTRSLAPADTAHADEILAEAAPDLRDEQLARKAAALEMKLNPEAVAVRKEHAKRTEQRVEARRENSGNASLAGRELDTADVLASKAYLDAIAAKLRASGLVDGPLDRLRALALTDLTQGRDPLDRLKPGPPPAMASTGPSPGSPAGPPNGADPGTPAPLPAVINLIVPAGTLLGWSTAPAQAGVWGLLDADDTRTIVTAAAAHPATRWCVTLTGPDGAALAHGCARGPRPRLLDQLGSQLGPQPPPQQLTGLLRGLNLTFSPIAQDRCDHAHAEDGYVPSRKLRHLIRARSATCDAPGCHSPAVATDLDHTVPWPAGPTDQCNLAPRCRTHHRAKQAPDWTVEQVAPGIRRWTLPSGRFHLTTSTSYDIH
jgi:predicted CxxxxCH...CXXCH cytochrome family protein